MDGPTVSGNATKKDYKAFRIGALCICVVAVSFGLIDLSAGYHRIGSTCFSAAGTCYFANTFWPHRWFQIFAVVLSIAAIGAFFVGTK